MIPRRLAIIGANCSGLICQVASVTSGEMACSRLPLRGLNNRWSLYSAAYRYRLFDNDQSTMRHYATVPNNSRMNHSGSMKHVSNAASKVTNRAEEKSASDISRERVTAEDGEKYEVIKVETKAQLTEILKKLPQDTQVMGSKGSTSISELLQRANQGKPAVGAAASSGDTLANLSEQSEQNLVSERLKELEGEEKEEPKLPRKGLGAGFAIVAILTLAQGVHTFAPDDWDQHFAVTIPESPFGSTVKLNPIAMIFNVFTPANASEWVLNTFVGFYTFRVLAIVFGNPVTVALGILAGAWANRTMLYEAEKTYVKTIEKETSDGGIVDEKVKYCKGLDKTTSNTTFIFSIAAFVGCIFPNALLPLIGPCPLVGLPIMGAL
ncbi:hypothetical protein V1517DRAFT_321018 [Lipomyces orientalis]|uniref:Uncharacterized protein n=1 Tax=Lipomyces orientalis TaxID=1233043 RepID=A0ACC3TQQ8_9ASCO